MPSGGGPAHAADGPDGSRGPGPGGGIPNLGHLTLDRVLLRQNSATTVPDKDGGSLEVSGSVFFQNSADGEGGGGDYLESGDTLFRRDF